MEVSLRPSYATPTGNLVRPNDPNIVTPCPHFHQSLPSTHITFRHPGYPNPGNILFRLPAHDGCEPDGDHELDDGHVDRRRGVHHGTALEACSIIACNSKGFLSPRLLQSPPDHIPSLNSLLTAKVYYFYPSAWIRSRSQEDLVYPVCPSFKDWQFPHGAVPTDWMSVYKNTNTLPNIPKPSQYSIAVAQRDGTCRVSGFKDCTETAHLVPWVEDGWFTRNEMEIYNLNAGLPNHLLTSDIQNCLRLRSDIHSQLDAGNFVFVPKCGTSCIHFLTPTHEYGRLLHNRKTEEFNVAPEFVYARFAWAVLPLAQAFAAKIGVKLRVWSTAQHSWEEILRGPVMLYDSMLPPDIIPHKRSRAEGSASGSASGCSRGNPGGLFNTDCVPTSPPSPAANKHDQLASLDQNPERPLWHPDVQLLETASETKIYTRNLLPA
ncbi:hypothetical protein Q9L58_010220, partial [Maublancomyces gigas]